MKEEVSNEKVIISFNVDSGSSNDHKSSSTDLCIYRRAKTTGEIMAFCTWLSPTRAGAEQAYQDYMDGKIDVPEADAYLGRNKQTKIEEKKNSTSTTNKTSQKTGSEDTTDTKNTDTKNTESQTSATSETTTTTTEKTVTTETKEQQKQKEEKKKQEQKKEKKKHMTGITIAIAAVAVFAILVLIMRKKM